jgi:hypothetical protein
MSTECLEVCAPSSGRAADHPFASAAPPHRGGRDESTALTARRSMVLVDRARLNLQTRRAMPDQVGCCGVVGIDAESPLENLLLSLVFMSRKSRCARIVYDDLAVAAPGRDTNGRSAVKKARDVVASLVDAEAC